MKIYIIIFICSFSPELFAQMEEFETSYQYCFEDKKSLNLSYLSDNIKGKEASSETFKIDLTKGDYSSKLYLSNFIFENIKNGTMKAYSIEEGVQLTFEEITDLHGSIDTIITFDPETFAERRRTVKTFALENIFCYKIQQLWTINGDNIEGTVTKIIPLYKEKDKYKELFYLKMINDKKEELINNKSISWLKVNAEYLPFDKIRAKSNSLKELIWEKPKRKEVELFYGHFHSNMYNTPNKVPMNHFEMLTEHPSVDTLITFNPETYAETINVYVHQKIKYEDICGFKIYQAWYIDHDNLTIGSKILGIIPLIKRQFMGNEKDYFVSLYLMIINELK